MQFFDRLKDVAILVIFIILYIYSIRVAKRTANTATERIAVHAKLKSHKDAVLGGPFITQFVP